MTLVYKFVTCLPACLACCKCNWQSQRAPSGLPAPGNDSNIAFEGVDDATPLFLQEHPAGCPPGTVPYRVSNAANPAGASLLAKHFLGHYGKPEAGRSFQGLPTSTGTADAQHLVK